MLGAPTFWWRAFVVAFVALLFTLVAGGAWLQRLGIPQASPWLQSGFLMVAVIVAVVDMLIARHRRKRHPPVRVCREALAELASRPGWRYWPAAGRFGVASGAREGFVSFVWIIATRSHRAVAADDFTSLVAVIEVDFATCPLAPLRLRRELPRRSDLSATGSFADFFVGGGSERASAPAREALVALARDARTLDLGEQRLRVVPADESLPPLSGGSASLALALEGWLDAAAGAAAAAGAGGAPEETEAYEGGAADLRGLTSWADLPMARLRPGRWLPLLWVGAALLVALGLRLWA